jgi:hypothetical protein
MEINFSALKSYLNKAQDEKDLYDGFDPDKAEDYRFEDEVKIQDKEVYVKYLDKRINWIKWIIDSHMADLEPIIQEVRDKQDDVNDFGENKKQI